MFFWAQICVVLLPSSFLCSSSLEKCETLKNSWIKRNMTLLSPKHQGIIDIILIMDTKHSSVPVIKKKMNPIPAEIRTKLLMKLWRVPWRKPCSYFFPWEKWMKQKYPPEKGRASELDAGGWCWWELLFWLLCSPPQQRAKETQRPVGLSLPLKYQHLWRLIQ